MQRVEGDRDLGVRKVIDFKTMRQLTGASDGEKTEIDKVEMLVNMPPDTLKVCAKPQEPKGSDPDPFPPAA